MRSPGESRTACTPKHVNEHRKASDLRQLRRASKSPESVADIGQVALLDRAPWGALCEAAAFAGLEAGDTRESLESAAKHVRLRRLAKGRSERHG
jgi:hypothetical protein